MIDSYLPYALRECDVELQGDGFAMAISGRGSAAVVLSDEEDLMCGDGDEGDASDNEGDQTHPSPRTRGGTREGGVCV